MSSITRLIKNGIIDENPVLVQVLGMCPTLAVTSSSMNGMGMGLATTSVLVGSNLAIALLRKIIPSKVRIPAFIVIIATFVTIVELLLKGYLPSLYDSLGLFIPLIVVNCIVLGRAEAFASKNTALHSAADGLGMGLGFTLSLTVLGSVRELIGAGSIFGLQLLSSYWYQPVTIFVLAPGAFIALGLLFAAFNAIKAKSLKG
jgi:electron transport complex protein RnfE